MNNLFIAKRSVSRVYRQTKDNSYSYRFYQDLSTCFSITLSENDKDREFYTFEPRGCMAESLLCARNHFDLNHRIEQTIDMTMQSLLMYGRAYIYLQPQYVKQESNEDKKMPTQQIISALDIGEVRGIVKQRVGNKYIFYSMGFHNDVIEKELLADGLIRLNIKELGYRKNFFPKLLKKLGKCDVLSSELLISENVKGYDYKIHTKKKRLDFLKKTKSMGWTFGNEDLSDSYILYRKILQDKFKIKALDFIIDKINEGLSICLHNESAGKLVAHIRRLDYDDIWKKYSRGEITVTELTNLLYNCR